MDLVVRYLRFFRTTCTVQVPILPCSPLPSVTCRARGREWFISTIHFCGIFSRRLWNGQTQPRTQIYVAGYFFFFRQSPCSSSWLETLYVGPAGLDVTLDPPPLPLPIYLTHYLLEICPPDPRLQNFRVPESPSGIMKLEVSGPTPEFLIAEVCGRTQEICFW